MFRFILFIIAGLISSVLFTTTSAETKISFENHSSLILPDTILLDELVVTGSRLETSTKQIPFAVTQITESAIQQSGHYNILSTVNTHVPGFFITERNILGFGVAVGGSGAINIRGIGSAPNTQVLVLIDGHPQYQGIFGHPLSDAYVASDVEKVEVIRGPASVLYGSNAMGGAINIITRKAVTDGWTGHLTAAYGSFDTRKYALTSALKQKKLNAFVAINHGSTDGIRENTDFEISNGYAKIGYDLSPYWKVNSDVSIAQYQANDNGPVHAPALFSIDILRGKAAISAENQHEDFEGAIKAYHNFGTHSLSDGWESSDRNSGLMIYQTYRLGTATRITAGLEARQYGGTGNKGASANQLKQVNELSAYTLLRHQLWNMLDLTAGLRREHHSVFGAEWVPMGGVTARVTPLTTFKGIVSKGFRSPTVMELYTYAPNPELIPERMMNYEMSWMQSWLNARLNSEVTVFIAEGENLIQVVGVGPTAKRQNVGIFNHKGMEVSARYELNRTWHMSANYSYLNTEKPVLAAPKHQLNLHLGFRQGIYSANLSAQRVSGLYTVLPTPSRDAQQQAYALLNARAAMQIRPKIEIFLSGQNLLNTQYEVNHGYPMPGINVHGGVKLGW